MKKKLLIIFFIILIVIFLILFIFKDENIEEIINNTIEYNKTKDYKYSLTFENIYNLDDKKISTKINYIEIKHDNIYKFNNKYYNNNTLTKETINYVEENNNKILLYYFDDKSYKEKEINNIHEAQDFNIDLDKFLKKINSLTKISKKTYKTKMKTTDAFYLIYSNTSNKEIEDKLTVLLKINKNSIEEINFKAYSKDKKEEYLVKLKLDYLPQEINLPIK